MIIRQMYEDEERLSAVEFVFRVCAGHGVTEPLQVRLHMYLEMERPTRRHKYRNTGLWTSQRALFYNTTAESRIESPPELTDKVKQDVMNSLLQRVRIE